MFPVALAATLHDTDARLVPAIERLGEGLRELFAGIALNASDATHAAVLAAARERLGAKLIVHPQGEAGIGRARRDAVRLALEFPAPAILYCDFDHLIRWARSDAAELRATLAAEPEVDFLVVGHSAQAFAAEPRRLQDTERLVNHAYALLTGHPWDLMFAVRRMSRRAAEDIVRLSVVDTIANDVEWPLLAERSGLSLGYAAANGLHYRTMEDFDAAADRKDGDALEWIRRIEFAAQHAAAMRPYLSGKD
ncbi:MAG TPA: hypothetical protein VII56_05615 [Rhizomicrobium sp.]